MPVVVLLWRDMEAGQAGRLVVVMGRRVRPEKHNMRPEVLVDTGQAALVTSD